MFAIIHMCKTKHIQCVLVWSTLRCKLHQQTFEELTASLLSENALVSNYWHWLLYCFFLMYPSDVIPASRGHERPFVRDPTQQELLFVLVFGWNILVYLSFSSLCIEIYKKKLKGSYNAILKNSLFRLLGVLLK